MIDFFEIFSNRELSLLIWSFFVVVFILLYKPTRNSLLHLSKVFFSKSLVTIHLSFVGYVTLSLILLQWIDFWDVSLLKDTVFWMLGFAIILLFRVTRMARFKDFIQIFKDSIKWTIIVEFIVAFYVFSLPVELVLIPVVTLIALLQAYSEVKEGHDQVNKLLKGVLSVIGLSILVFVTYKTFYYRGDLISFWSFNSFLLPVLLTILLIPYLYLISLYVTYESLFVRLSYLIHDGKAEKRLKIQIIRVCNFNLNKISNVSTNIAGEVLKSNQVPTDRVKLIANSSEFEKL